MKDHRTGRKIGLSDKRDLVTVFYDRKDPLVLSDLFPVFGKMDQASSNRKIFERRQWRRNLIDVEI